MSGSAQRMNPATARSTPKTLALQLLAFAVFACGHVASCLGQSGFTSSLPVPNNNANVPPLPPLPPIAAASATTYSPLSGLHLSVDAWWPCIYGYRPVEFKFECAKPATADRSITVTYSEYDWRNSDYRMTVEDDIDMPAGTTSVTLTIAAPQLASDKRVAWKVWVDGVYDPSLSRTLQDGIRISTPPLLLPQILDLESLPQLGSARSLPERWIDYSGLDGVKLPLEVLLETAEESPEKILALRQWLSTGGTLLLEEVGSDFVKLAEVSNLLELESAPRLLAKASSKGPLESHPEWTWAQLSKYAIEDQRTQPRSLWWGGKPRRDQPITDSEGEFAEASYGMGTIIAFATNENDQNNRKRRLRLIPYNERLPEMRWNARHGLEPNLANPDFSNLLPPSAGHAPINSFRILITVFVLIAGPLNFWLLARRQQMHLMVLSVPLLAFLSTAGLFAYATLSEGFGVEVRARSVTFLDQRRSEQTVWSQNCYYAGMAPKPGLIFPSDTAIYPVLPGWEDSTSARTLLRDRTITWADNEQRLGQEWLPPREPTQLLTVQATESKAKINFKQTSGQLEATNQLGSDIQLLVVRDESGKLWMAESIVAEAPTLLKPVELIEAVSELRVRILQAQPQPPIGLDMGDAGSLLSEQRRQQFRNSANYEYADTGVDSNLLNEAINSLIGLNGSDPLPIPLKSYVAICDQTGWYSLGLKLIDEANSFHVIVGRW